MRTINRIFIHTAAAASKGVPVDQSAETIRNYHVKTLKWADIAYNDVVRFSGDVEPGRPIEKVPAGVEGANRDSYHVVLTGHGDIAPPTEAQWNGVVELVARRVIEFGMKDAFIANPMRVVGHREVNQLIDAGVYPNAPKTIKSCPGKRVDMRAFRVAVMAEVLRLEDANAKAGG